MAFPHRLERHAMKAAAAKRKGLSAVTWQSQAAMRLLMEEITS